MEDSVFAIFVASGPTSGRHTKTYAMRNWGYNDRPLGRPCAKKCVEVEEEDENGRCEAGRVS